MNFALYIKEIGRGAAGSTNLGREEAEQLYAAILDGGVPDLELGAIMLALRMKGESRDEMSGFLRAVDSRIHALDRPAVEARPIVLPSYNGARKGANLTPLLALMLQRFGVPVLVHGLLEGFGRVSSGRVLRELGVMPASTLGQVQLSLEKEGLAFAPLSILCPGLSDQLALRARLGLRNCAHSLVKMLDPFRGEGVLIAAATHPPYLDLMRDLLLEKIRRHYSCGRQRASPLPIPSVGQRSSISVRESVPPFSRPSTTASSRCPICRKRPMPGRRRNGRRVFWMVVCRCLYRLPTNWSAVSMRAAMLATSTRPRHWWPLRPRRKA